MPKFNGVAALLMDYGSAGMGICTGSLMQDRRSILTAAHCVSHGTDSRPLRTMAFFYAGNESDPYVPGNPGAYAFDISDYFVHADYTGHVFDQNDIAVLRMDAWAPTEINAFGLWSGELTGQTYNVAGYGMRSLEGGAAGSDPTLSTGFLRQGTNRYDFGLDDADFGGAWSAILGEPGSQIGKIHLSDFDSGKPENDLSCHIGAYAFGGDPAKYCDLGGELEVSTAPGDSGGPQFIDGQVASVTSFGLSLGPYWGDAAAGLNSSFGEFNGFVPVSLHADFIRTTFVPEPASMALVGLGLLGPGPVPAANKTAERQALAAR